MKKKVAFFVVGLNSGGIENYLLRFLKHYKNDIEPTVYCKSGNIGDLENEFSNEGIKVKKFKIGYFNPNDISKLKKELKKEKFDSVVDFTGNFSAFTMMTAKKVGVKKRLTWYRNADDKFKKDFLRMLYSKFINRLTLKNASSILSNSKAALDYFYKDYSWKKDQRFEVIYNGLDAKSFLSTKEDLRKEFNIPEAAFVVGNVGRYNEQKNHKTAIEVAISLCEKYDDIYFIFCGKGVDQAYMEYIKNKGLSDRIILSGMRRDIIKVLNTLDCFYFPSIIEGQPNALIEAMIANVPFVASNIEPVKETTPEDLHTYLLPPLDINKAKSTILNIKMNNDFRSKFLIKDWAIHNFNSDVQFKKFFDKI